MSARQVVQGIRDGLFSAEDVVRACLAQIEEKEPQVQAWTHLDPEHALKQARNADQLRSEGKPLGPLHGVPVGIKDVIDTRDMPTEDGTPLHSGRSPWQDAKVVDALRAAGAIILGKTVTTEMATMHPGKTRNPHNPEHTPGGSSSGSAAAVAAGMVPLAVGTQTNGSVIRPAAFCGVFGFKPTRGFVSTRGILRQSALLDQVGVFARTVEDLALIGEVVCAYDEYEPSMRPRGTPPLLRVCEEEPPLPPTLALVRTPWWDELDAEVREGFSELVEHLGERIGEFELPPSAVRVLDWHRTLMEADIAASYDTDYEKGKEQMSELLRAQIERGRGVSLLEYRRAEARITPVTEAIDEVFDRFDAILTPAVHGPAPKGLESTGNPQFCTLWTFCGMPAINLPLLTASNGLPIGVQLVGRVGDDARLLRTARWLLTTLA